MSTYFELLKHPKWQKKRLEVLKAAGFECEHCGDKEKTLHVHHKYYKKGLKPWEYSNQTLICLCEGCHEMVRKSKDEFDFLMGCLPLRDSEILLGIAKGVYLKTYKEKELFLNTALQAYGLAFFLRINKKRITCLIKNKISWHKLEPIIKKKKRKING